MAHDGLWQAQFDALVKDWDAPGAELDPLDTDTPDLVPAATTYPVHPGPPGFVVPERSSRRPLAERARGWIVSRTGIQTTAVSVGVPSAVWGLAELAAWQHPGWTGAASAVMILGGSALGLASLTKHFGNAATLTGVTVAVSGLQTAMSVAPSPLAGFLGWCLGAATAGSLRVFYANARKEPDAKVDILRAQEELVRTKVITEQYKAAAQAHRAQLEQARAFMALQAAQPKAIEHHGLPYTPTLRGDETGTETALLYALTPGRWADMAEERGLAGTAVVRAVLTDAGVEVDLRLDGRWDPAKLASAEGAIRALASVETATRVQIGPGRTGDQARILIRTRSASDGMSLDWTPEHKGLGVDEITGDIVHIDLSPGNHILVAGVTGTGKSFSWRPLVMDALRKGWAVMLLDPKRQEAGVWAGKIRTIGDQQGTNDDIRQLVFEGLQELMEEMQHRQAIATGSAWDPTPEYPNILAIVEEGRQLIEMDRDPRWKGTLSMLDDLYTLARAVGMEILYATQYPSRSNGGITAMVDENTSTTICLTVSGPVSDRVVFGENAQETGWEPSKLDGEKGRALIKQTGSKPNPVRIWKVTDDMVEALPDAEPWKSGATRKPLSGADNAKERVRAYRAANPEASNRATAAACGVSETSVRKYMKDA